ncbi:MAG: LssY C-terminal domain-containing protein [Acidobacteria bacterium]|nr:LssY C-terminal domain-containing protein [Acidobacteriota bacterium]
MIHSKRFQSSTRRQSCLPSGAVLLSILGLAAAGPTFSPAQTQSGEPSRAIPALPSSVPSIAPRIEPIIGMRNQKVTSAAEVPAHKQNYEFTLKDGSWLDTGVFLAAGELADFTVTGNLTLADNRQVTPGGLDRGWKDLLRQFPLNQAKVGAVIGRISDTGASVPFSIGASGQVSMPTTGKLYLAVNVSSDLTFTGEYKVKVRFSKPETFKTNVLAVPATPIDSMLTPAIFADIPRRVSDSASDTGNPGDMVNFALIGTREQVEAAFKAAAWVAVDKSVQDAIVNGLLKTLGKEAYTEMPMSTLYLFGRPQDMSFARADPLMVAAERHHLRVWQTNKTVDGRPLWVGSSTHDIGFEKDQRTGGVTHKIDPEIDKERDYLLQSFDAAGAYASAAYVTPSNPMLEAHTATGGSFHSDGRIVVMNLK